MTILNLTNDGLPNVLIVLYMTVARSRKALSRDEIVETIAPAEVTDNGKMARQTLTRWTELGLFDEDPDGTVRLATPLKEKPTTDAEWRAAVRKVARACALSTTNNQQLWATESAKAADLTRALAWLLAQDVYTFAFSSAEELENAQIERKDRRLLGNDTRRNGLQTWAVFLGFVRRSPGVDVDPTVAVRDVIPNILRPGESMDAEGFVDALAGQLPVLDRGSYRTEVERAFREEARPQRVSYQLSTSLSRAFLSLRVSRDLEFLQKADQGSGVVFSGAAGILAGQLFQTVVRPLDALP
jgi:hypothetical protein